MRNRRSLIMLTAIAVVATVVVALFLVSGSQAPPGVNQARTPAAGPTAEPSQGVAFDVNEAARLQDALASGDPARLAPVISMASGDQIGDQFAAQLEESDLRIDAATFMAGEQGTGTVEASTMIDGVAARWLLVLTSVSGQWQLSTTAQMS